MEYAYIKNEFMNPVTYDVINESVSINRIGSDSLLPLETSSPRSWYIYAVFIALIIVSLLLNAAVIIVLAGLRKHPTNLCFLTLVIEILLEVHTVGICGTDISILKNGYLPGLPFTAPFVLGHEASGVVEKVGRSVTNLKEGDHVCIEVMVPCEKCKLCKAGEYQVCKHAMWPGLPSTDGFLRKYSVHRASYCFKLPESMNIEHGVFMEPLSCGVYACELAEVKPNSRVLVTGAGPLAIAACIAAKGMGAAEVCLTGTRRPKLEMGLKNGADHIVFCDTTDPYVLCDKVVEKLGQKADMTIECSGSKDGVMLACLATENAGIVSLVGLSGQDIPIPLDSIILRGIQIRGVSKYSNSFPGAIHFASNGLVDFGSIITHRFPISKAVDAYKLVMSKTGETMKVVIQFHSD